MVDDSNNINTENNFGDGDIASSETEKKTNFSIKDFNNLTKYNYYELLFKSFITTIHSTGLFLKTVILFCFNKDNETAMSRRQKHPEPIGPISIIRSIRDQIQLFQDKRGISADENNFINLLSVIAQQAGNAMYAVFTMFLALLPVGNIIIHTIHFILDRLIDIMTTKKRKDLWFKGSVFILQMIFIYLVIHFVFAAIFVPIFAMQTTIVSKILFMEDSSSTETQCVYKTPCTFQDKIVCNPPVITPIIPPPSIVDIVGRLLSIKAMLVSFFLLFVSPF